MFHITGVADPVTPKLGGSIQAAEAGTTFESLLASDTHLIK